MERYYNDYYKVILEDGTTGDKAKDAVFRIIADLTDRRGIKHEFNSIDDDIQDEIVDTWTEIIKQHLNEM